MTLTHEQFLAMVDHSILKPETTPEETVAQAIEVAKVGVFSVCVKSNQVSQVFQALQNYDTKIAAVVGFPHGNSSVRVKITEALEACQNGAEEIDVVADFSNLLSNNDVVVRNEVIAMAEFAREVKASYPFVKIKVILESALFNKEKLQEICSQFGWWDPSRNIDFLKTSTGFHPSGGATVESVSILSNFGHTETKASGGVRSKEDAILFVEAGATRLGCGSTIAVAEQF